MREIVLDTETTGLDPANGHRIVGIGCVELLNAIPTGETFHAYIDPGRDMPEEAFKVHGISAGFLAGKPVFAKVVADFLKFAGGAKIVAHNAEFDMRFLNAELALLDIEPIAGDRVPAARIHAFDPRRDDLRHGRHFQVRPGYSARGNRLLTGQDERRNLFAWYFRAAYPQRHV
jgi:DNA polymerase III epsilon subunit-like protein